MPKIALAQMAMSPGLEVNVEGSLVLIERASADAADVILFPEIHLSPFFPKHSGADASEYLLDLDNLVIRRFQRACRQARIFASPNLYLREDNKAYDASLLIDPDGNVRGVSKMVHITQVPGFFEQDYYAPSREGFRVYETDIGRIGIVICFDRHFPESFRACALQGADIVLVPTANVQGESLELFEWEIRTAAFHNSIYIAMCNRIGVEDGYIYCGQSLVAGPDGDLLHKMDGGEGLDVIDYDLDFVRERRENNEFLRLYSAEMSRRQEFE